MDERGNRGAGREIWRAREAASHRESEGEADLRDEGVKRESECLTLFIIIFTKFIVSDLKKNAFLISK